MPSKATDNLFHIGLIVKAVDAVFEVVGGVLFTMPTKLSRWLLVLSQHELYHHHQVLSGRLDRLADRVETHASIGEAVYLIVHGAAKVILVSAIFKEKKWGYLGMIWVLSIFGMIEFGQAIFKGEVLVAVLGIFDAALVYLIAKEYKSRFAERPIEPAHVGTMPAESE